MAIKVEIKGDFNNLKKYLQINNFNDILEKYGEMGVRLLSEVTPVRTGKTASSWYYKLQNNKGSNTLVFCNSNINKGVCIAIIIQYGHVTGTGGWVEGIDYINPVLDKLVDYIENDLQKGG